MYEWQKLIKQLEEQIRPSTFPLAIKFFENVENVPKEVRRPKVRVIGCNIFSLARRHGLSLAVTRDDIACSAIAILGFIEFSNEFVNWYANYLGSTYAKSPEAAEKTIKRFPKIEYGKFSAVMVSPAEKTEVEPDLLLVYMNPAQINQVLLGLYKKNEEGMSFIFETFEPVSTCASVARAYNTREPQLVLPGTGDRRYGLTQDDELAFVVPIERLADLVSGITESWNVLGRRYPVPMVLEVSPEIDEYQRGLNRFRK